ncbi:uncharacterized protein K02A2.6-like [Pectinophora gossypiella]|uniref:uncharacterized protein K02A2.6-like n=1 Tax=Pectinophora gossypiella TaxID=13191 RepID=UPI00214EA5AD|nr:uncharacterized protein K02A2.6-like [Pectinophora gossypiella]
MGMVKTKAHARSYVWWPGLDEAVEAACRACDTCAALQPAPPAAPPQPWRWPYRPYERVHLDFLGPIDGCTYLVTVDARSKWIEVFKMGRTTADATITKLRQSWARWGLPRQVVSDNGPPFSSKEFRDFLGNNGIEQMFTAPYHPSSNGAAENAVKTIKNVIKKARRENIDTQLAICRFLLVYHNTPHCTTGETPARLLQGRNLRTRLDVLKPDPTKLPSKGRTVVSDSSKVHRELRPGDPVWYRNFGQGTKWARGLIQERLGKSNYTVEACDGSPTHRHIDQIKRRPRGSCVFPEPMAESTNTSTGVDGGSERAAARGEAACAADADNARDALAHAVGEGQPVEVEAEPITGQSSDAEQMKRDEKGVPGSPPIVPSTDTSKRIRRPVKRYGFDFD